MKQSGFTPGRSWTDNVFVLRQVSDKRRAQGRETHLAFIDLTKAYYDTVPRKCLP